MNQESKSADSFQDEIFLWFWEKHERGEVLNPENLLAELIEKFGLEEPKSRQFLSEFIELAEFSGKHESEDSDHGEALTLSSFLHYEFNANVPYRRGGLASVHKAFDHRFDRPVAIKVPLKRFIHEQEVRSRIMREARLSARLQHPNIVPIYEFGESGPAGHPFFVMKYVEGRTLLEAIKSSSPGVASVLRFLKVVRETVGALEHAHSRGIIHRDIKPENIMIGQFNESHLLDFGCADEIAAIQEQKSFRARAIERFSQTVEGGVFGTYAYMSPEQARGHLQKQCDKTDVFGIGGLLCHILTGLPVYCGTMTEVIEAAKNCRTRDAFDRLQAQSIPKSLQKLTMSCLQLEPDQRPAAAEVGRILDDFFDSIAQESVRNERRARWATFGLMGALLTIVTFVGLWLLYDQYRAESVAEEAAWNLNESWAQQRLDEIELERQELTQQWRQIALEPIPQDSTEKLGRLQSAAERIESILQPSEAYPETIDKIKQLKENLDLDSETLQSEKARFEESQVERENTLALLRDLSNCYLHDETISISSLIGGYYPSSMMLDELERSFQAQGLDLRKSPSDRPSVWIEGKAESYKCDLSLFLFRYACIAIDEGDVEYGRALSDWSNALDPREALKSLRSIATVAKPERQRAFEKWKTDFPNATSPTVEILTILLEVVPTTLQFPGGPLRSPVNAYSESEILIATHFFVIKKIKQKTSVDLWELLAYLRGRGLDVDLWEIGLLSSLGNWEFIYEKYGRTTDKTSEAAMLNPLIAYASAKLDRDASVRELLALSNSARLSTKVAELLVLIELEKLEQAEVRLAALKKQLSSLELYSLLSMRFELALKADIQQNRWAIDSPELFDSPSARSFWIEYLLQHRRFQEALELVYSDLRSGKCVPKTIVLGIEAAIENDQWLEARDLFLLLQRETSPSATLSSLAQEILYADGTVECRISPEMKNQSEVQSPATLLNQFITQGNGIDAAKMIQGFTERDMKDQELSRAIARGYLNLDNLGLTDRPMLEHVMRYPTDLDARLMLHSFYSKHDKPEEGRLQLEFAFNTGQDAPLHLQLALFDCLLISGQNSLADQILKRLLFSEKNGSKLVQALKRQVHSSKASEK